MQVVKVNHLTKMYKQNMGISDVTFSINEGETFGFIGPNGAGKSTTIRTILNFIYPTSGSAEIFGLNIVRDSKEIRRKIGYIPSEVHYYDDMRAIDLLNYSSKFYQKVNPKRMKELIERLDLDVTRKVEDLSYGNRKKVGIVQALLHEPRLLIMDEPTGGLDPLMQNVFFEILKEERRKGTTIFFSSHILHEVQRISDRVAIIKEGKLLKVESIDQLLKNKVKNITIKFETTSNIKLECEGIIKQEKVNNQIKLLFNGNMKKLFKELDKMSFEDILIEEPSLEEVFMHYYEN